MVDASLIGYRFPSFSFPLEEGKLRELNGALLWPEGGDAVAPTFTALASFWTPPDLGAGLNLDLRRVLHGGSEWTYLAPVHAGEVLTVHAGIVDVREKQGRRGPMRIIVREERFDNAAGQTVVIRRSEIIELSPPKEDA